MVENPKIKQLRLRSPMTPTSTMSVDAKGELNDDRKGKAYFCVWGQRDTYGTVWVRGCFSKTIKERGPESGSKQKIVMVWQHDIRDPIGQLTAIVEDEYGAYCEYIMDDPDAVPSAKRAISQIRSGTINQWSFRFDWIWEKLEYDEKTDSILVKEAELIEISPVTRASIKETYSVRSVEEYEQDLLELKEETEYVIRSVPRKFQQDIKQLIDRHIALAKAEPQNQRQPALGTGDEPPPGQGDELSISKLLNIF